MFEILNILVNAMSIEYKILFNDVLSFVARWQSILAITTFAYTTVVLCHTVCGTTRWIAIYIYTSTRRSGKLSRGVILFLAAYRKILCFVLNDYIYKNVFNFTVNNINDDDLLEKIVQRSAWRGHLSYILLLL